MLPIPRPGKIVCVGLNYEAHAKEGGHDRPDYPALFTKFQETLIADGDPITVPPESEAVDYEAELAFVIGRPVRRAKGDAAIDAVGGYTVANDVSMRDYQYRSQQWLAGKNWAASTPLGPYLVTPDEVGDPHDLDISLRLDGETLQSANTSMFIFDIPTLVAHISAAMTLLPGDVILTGTPPGIGFSMTPPRRLRHGDVVEVEIPGVGLLSNPVVDDGAP
jgi:acylpyruvate hydrolase